MPLDRNLDNSATFLSLKPRQPVWKLRPNQQRLDVNLTCESVLCGCDSYLPESRQQVLVVRVSDDEDSQHQQASGEHPGHLVAAAGTAAVQHYGKHTSERSVSAVLFPTLSISLYLSISLNLSISLSLYIDIYLKQNEN